MISDPNRARRLMVTAARFRQVEQGVRNLYRLYLPLGPPFICTIGPVDSPSPDYQKGVTATVSGSLKAHS